MPVVIQDRSTDIAALSERARHMAEYLQLDAKRVEVAELEARTAQPGFWDDQSAAQALMAALSGLKEEVGAYEAVSAAVEEAETANELAVAEEDEGMAEEVETALADIAKRIATQIGRAHV